MHSVTQSPPSQDDLASLDRGVIEAGLIAARALARSDALERRVAVLERDLLDAYRELGRMLGISPPQPSALDRAAALGWLEGA